MHGRADHALAALVGAAPYLVTVRASGRHPSGLVSSVRGGWPHTGRVLGITDLPTYLVGLVLIILLPGPNSLYVLSVAARRGVRSGYAGAAGVWTGDAVLMTLSAAGVASLLQANPAAFAVVKWVGASYLLWLAIGMLRAAWGMWRSRAPSPTRSPTPPWRPASSRRPAASGPTVARW